MLTSETTSALLSPVVTLDWSHLSSMHQPSDIQTNITSFLEWVAGYPERRNIHVYVGGTVQSRFTRTLRQKLQSYGCVVTAKASFKSHITGSNALTFNAGSLQ